jgi:ubiquinol-cytochrome c reductase cytochrome c1 subunit
MVRILAFLVGLFFTGMLGYSAIRTSVSMIQEPEAETAEHVFHKNPEKVSFSFEGPFGRWDKAQLQRGFQVYKEVCASCHGLNRVAFRDLADLGYNEGQIKTLATGWATETPSINPDTGEAATRKSTAADKIPSPYANDIAARAANNNAVPPDLSLIAKARHGGPQYIYSLLIGYQAPPAKLAKEFPDSMPGKTTHFNPYFANLNLAMPAPLTSDGQVSYGEGAPKPTVKNMAKDVSAFLTWAAEPKMMNRKAAGIPTIIFLLIFAGLCWASYQTIWADKKKKA